MKKLTLFFLCLIMGVSWAAAQNRTITGHVTSAEDKQPVIGATVVVVGTKAGTATDIDGNFKLSVPANAKQLKISYVGLKSKVVPVKDRVDVVLESDAKDLGNVVVVGYGTGQKLSTVSGSVTKITAEKIADRPVANVMDALQGQVAGMQVVTGSGEPSALSRIRIHGDASLGASGAPLYVLDGVPVSQATIQMMNPESFESVTTLKDASATSIYGSRAANGVIYITTKKGKLNEAGRISFSAQYGVSMAANRGLADRLLNSQQLLAYQAEHLLDPGTTGQDWYNKMKDDMGLDVAPGDFDWFNYFMGKKAPTMQGDISFQGGSAQTRYYISGSYFNQEGISRSKSNFSKYSFRSNLDSRIKPWAKIGLNISAAYSNTKTARFQGKALINDGPLGSYLMPPYYSAFDPQGQPYYRFKMFPFGAVFTPDYYNRYFPSFYNSYLGTAVGYIQLNPIQGLTIKSQAGIEYSVDRGTGRLLVGNFSDSRKEGSRTESYAMGTTFTNTNTAEYKFRIADKNNFTALIGTEYIHGYSESLVAETDGIVSDDMSLLGEGRIGTSLVPPSQSIGESANFSLFSRLNYSFNNWLYLDASVRSDRSSVFGQDNQTGVFWSTGAMLDLHKLIMPENEKVSTLSLKGSYGTQGNSGIGSGANYRLMGYTHYTDRVAMGVNSIGNPNIHWEKQAMASVGFNLGFWNDRLTLGASFYNRKTTDMLMAVVLPLSSGFTSYPDNVGSMTNRGLDVEMTAGIVRTKDWAVDFSANFNYNKERIDQLFNGFQEWSPGSNSIYRVGYARSMYVVRFAGIDPNTGEQTWYVPGTHDPATGKQKITKQYSENLRQLDEKASVIPPISGGFSFHVGWKRQLDLNMDFAYVLGSYAINNDRFFLLANQPGQLIFVNKDKEILNAWKQKGDEGRIVGKFGEQMQFDDRLVENTSFLRLKNIQLAYTLPKSVFKGQDILSGAKVYVAARNLLTFTKFLGADPEAAGTILSINNYPNTRMFVAGIQLSL